VIVRQNEKSRDDYWVQCNRVHVVLNIGVDLVDYSNLDQSKLIEMQKEAAKRAAELEAEEDGKKKKKKRKKKKKSKRKSAMQKMQQLKVNA